MTTKIDSYVSASADTSRNTVKSVEPGSRSGGDNSPAANVSRIDSVKLTPDAVQLQQLEARIAKIPVADHQRVAKVKQAIENGTYKIDSQKIASKLARMEWDLSTK